MGLFRTVGDSGPIRDIENASLVLTVQRFYDSTPKRAIESKRSVSGQIDFALADSISRALGASANRFPCRVRSDHLGFICLYRCIQEITILTKHAGESIFSMYRTVES